MKGREREIFRDAYNLLEKNDLDHIKEDAANIINKYDTLDDKMLAIDILKVIEQHMRNIRLGWNRWY